VRKEKNAKLKKRKWRENWLNYNYNRKSS